jgi:ceramide glucosyltransferase
VERLIAAARVAAGDIFFISDSNVRAEPDDLAATVAAFEDSGVGCVSNLFIGSGARTFGATIESFHLLGFVVPGAVLGDVAGMPCVVGKSMAISRSVHDAIGGFTRFRRVLAEDQAIALAVADEGLRVVLSPIVVRNIVVDRSVKRALDRQVRWNKIRYSFSHRLYAGEPVINPFVFALLAFAAMPGQLAFVPVIVAAIRILQFALLNRSTKAGMRWHQLALTPLLDLLMLYTWCAPFFSNRVTWRGYQARIGRDTELLPLAA